MCAKQCSFVVGTVTAEIIFFIVLCLTVEVISFVFARCSDSMLQSRVGGA